MRRIYTNLVRSLLRVRRGKFQKAPSTLAAIGVGATLVLALIVVIALLQTGGPNSISTNAALIGALIALGGVFTTQLVNTGLEAQRAGEAALQKYFEQMRDSLADPERPLHRSTTGDALSTIARAQTLAVLEGLDPDRKRILLQFLYESNLIKVDKPIVSLHEANLNGANLNRAYLDKADLHKADLGKADLNGAYLSKAEKLSQPQINEADGDQNTKLPNHLQRPAHWRTGDEQESDDKEAPPPRADSPGG